MILTFNDIISTSDYVLLNIFNFPYLKNEECSKLLDTVFSQSIIRHEGSMQKYTIDVTSVLKDFLYNRCIPELTPIISNLFYNGNNCLFTVYTAHIICYSYEGEGEKNLKIHTDDSDITVNITLESTDLEGCEVQFHGTTMFANTELIKHFGRAQRGIGSYSTQRIAMKVGECVLHQGNHPHQTLQIKRGVRKALIIWLKKNINININKNDDRSM